jgi:hypothetical protein
MFMRASLLRALSRRQWHARDVNVISIVAPSPRHNRHVTELAREYLQRTREALDTAFQGYFVLKDHASRRTAGFRNVVVFGAHVRKVLETLPPDGGEFDKWYKPIRKEFKNSLLMKLFEQLLAEVRKREAAGVDSKARVVGFNYPADVPKLGKRPSHARELFMGDNLGGVGWEVEVLPGVVEKYYAILPAAYGTVEEFLSFTAIVQTSKDPRPIDAVKVSEQYITTLEKVLRGADQHL